MTLNLRQQNKHDNQHPESPTTAWDDAIATAAVPIGKIAGTAVAVSYSIFFALAGVIAAVAFLATRPGNGDLYQVALVGVSVWSSGLVIQLATAIGFAACAGLKLRGVVIGLFGLELPIHRWSPERTLLLIAACFKVLIAMGAALWMINLFYLPSDLAFDANATKTTRSGMPALGFGRADEAWRAAAWLIWFQALCQCVPLPRMLGRVGLLATVAVFDRSIDTDPKIRTAGKVIRLAAIVMMLASLAWFTPIGAVMVPTWVLFAVLAGLLWISATNGDMVGWLDSFAVSGLPDGAIDSGDNILTEYRNWQVGRRQLKSLQDAQLRERSEAADVERLDAILEQLHREGLDSLSTSDREVLQRVSQRMKQLQSDTDS